MRGKILKALYKRFPFDLKGDCTVPPARDGIRISCIINFYGRLDLLSGILHSLAQQKFPRESFEVVLVEDRGGSEEGKRLAEEFAHSLNVNYVPLDKHFGFMGYSRNFALSRSRGEYILFLDDDTVILQEDFLDNLLAQFESHPDEDAIVPCGEASFAVIEGKYDYHDPFFMTSRCTAYRRTVLAELGGFYSDFIGQEDVEFVIRFLIADKKALNAADLKYHHPPLLVDNFRKPMAVGISFYGMRQRYRFPVWLLTLLNCSRHLPLVLVPLRRCREMGRFGIGFVLGLLSGVFNRANLKYG